MIVNGRCLAGHRSLYKAGWGGTLEQSQDEITTIFRIYCTNMVVWPLSASPRVLPLLLRASRASSARSLTVGPVLRRGARGPLVTHRQPDPALAPLHIRNNGVAGVPVLGRRGMKDDVNSRPAPPSISGSILDMAGTAVDRASARAVPASVLEVLHPRSDGNRFVSDVSKQIAGRECRRRRWRVSAT